MTQKTAVAGLVAALVLTATGAFAAGTGDCMKDGAHHRGMHHGGMRHSFEEIDLNGDGEVTREEMTRHRQARFASADTDGDGKLSPAEMEAAAMERMKARVANMIERFDTDGDGFLSADEMPRPKRGDRMFDRVDADDNGSISREEFTKVRAMRKDRGHGHGRMKRHGCTD